MCEVGPGVGLIRCKELAKMGFGQVCGLGLWGPEGQKKGIKRSEIQRLGSTFVDLLESVDWGCGVGARVGLNYV